MLTEAINTLVELADARRHPEILQELSDRTAVAFFDESKQVMFVNRKAPPREHHLADLQSLVAAVARYRDRDSDEGSLWVSLDQIVCVLDDRHFRVNRLTLPLSPHEAFALLEHSKWMTQRQLIDLLRHDLCGCTLSPPSTLDTLRSLRFAVQAETTGKFTNSSSAMGKSVQAEVTGEIEIPETVAVELAPYPDLADDLDMTVTVYCTLFSDPEKGLLKLTPQPGQLDEARRRARLGVVHLIREMLDSDCKDLPVFSGHP